MTPKKALEALQEVIGSVGQALDIWAMLYAGKPAARLVVRADSILSVRTYLESLGLRCAIEVGGLELLPRESGFADNAIRSPRGRWRVLHIAFENPSRMVGASDAELGALLGYPSCCVDSFVQAAERVDKDFTLFAKKVMPWELNVALRHWDVRLCAHFPCGRCGPSLEYAQQFFKKLEEHVPELACILEQSLRGVVVYDRDPVLLVDAKREGGEWVFSGLRGNHDTLLFAELMQKKRVHEERVIVYQ